VGWGFECRMSNLEASCSKFEIRNSKFFIQKLVFAPRPIDPLRIQPSAFYLSGHPLKSPKSRKG
jgi:hypothetical protein